MPPPNAARPPKQEKEASPAKRGEHRREEIGKETERSPPIRRTERGGNAVVPTKSWTEASGDWLAVSQRLTLDVTRPKWSAPVAGAVASFSSPYLKFAMSGKKVRFVAIGQKHDI